MCRVCVNRRRTLCAVTSSGASTVLTQGYLLKRSSNMRADWKRRFFVLDALGHLTYYRDKARLCLFCLSLFRTISRTRASLFIHICAL